MCVCACTPVFVCGQQHQAQFKSHKGSWGRILSRVLLYLFNTGTGNAMPHAACMHACNHSHLYYCQYGHNPWTNGTSMRARMQVFNVIIAILHLYQMPNSCYRYSSTTRVPVLADYFQHSPQHPRPAKSVNPATPKKRGRNQRRNK